MIRIADAREIKTVEDARQVFQDIAQRVLEVESLQADAERSIAEIKAQVSISTADTRGEITRMESSLAAFILGHKGLFQKPRKIKTEFGDFGLQTSTELKVDDLPAALAHAREHKLPCLKVEESWLKGEAAKLIAAGEVIPGCRVVSGDTAVYKVSRTWLAGQLKETADVAQG